MANWEKGRRQTRSSALLDMAGGSLRLVILSLVLSSFLVQRAISQGLPGSQQSPPGGECEPSDLTGYVCSKSLPLADILRIAVHWAAPVDNRVDMAAVVNSDAWLSVGWGVGMPRSYAVVGQDNVSALYLAGYNPTTFADVPVGFIDHSSLVVSRADGMTTMKFTRFMNSSVSPLSLNEPSWMIYALGRSTEFKKHIHSGRFTLDLSYALMPHASANAMLPSSTLAVPSAATDASAPAPPPNTSAMPSAAGPADASNSGVSCDPSDLPGLTCSKDLLEGRSLHWNPPASNGGLEIAFRLQQRVAWASVGWTPDGTMKGDSVIGGKDPQPGAYYIESQDPAGIRPTDHFIISDITWNVTDASTILRFKRQVGEGSIPTDQPGTLLMWAHSKPNADGFNYHGGNKGSMSQPFWTEPPGNARMAEAQQGSVDLGGSKIFQWSRVESNGKQMLRMTFQILGTASWLSVGWSQDGEMAGNCVIGQTGGNVTTNRITAKSKAGIIDTQEFNINEASFISTSNGSTVLQFSRPIDNGDIRESGVSGMIWAYGLAPGFEYHGEYKGSFNVDFSTGKGSTTTLSKRYYNAHAWMMWIAFGIFFPFGVLLARYGKRYDPLWFNAHVSIQFLAVVISTAAFIIAVAKFDALGTLHGRLGIAVMVLVWLQPVIGLARPHKGTQERVPWYFIHWMFGTGAMIFGALNIFYGIDEYKKHGNVPKAITVLFSVEVALLVAAYLTLNELPYILSQSDSAQQKFSLKAGTTGGIGRRREEGDGMITRGSRD